LDAQVFQNRLQSLFAEEALLILLQLNVQGSFETHADQEFEDPSKIDLSLSTAT